MKKLASAIWRIDAGLGTLEDINLIERECKKMFKLSITLGALNGLAFEVNRYLDSTITPSIGNEVCIKWPTIYKYLSKFLTGSALLSVSWLVYLSIIKYKSKVLTDLDHNNNIEQSSSDEDMSDS